MDKNAQGCATIRISRETHALIKELSKRSGVKVWRIANDLLNDVLKKKLASGKAH
jgi:hypothetical protein